MIKISTNNIDIFRMKMYSLYIKQRVKKKKIVLIDDGFDFWQKNIVNYDDKTGNNYKSD